MKKRIISLLLVLVLAIGICPAAFAAEVGTETAEVEAVVENYLRDSVHNMFFWKEAEKDIAQNTTLATQEKDSGLALKLGQSSIPAEVWAETATPAQKFHTELKEALSGTSRKVMEPASTLELQEQRIQYYRHLKETQNITYSSFKADYTFLDTVVSGSHALVNVYEALNYQYSDCEEPSYEGQDYSVTLVKVDGKWVVAEVLSDDMFFSDYYGTDFDLTAVLQDYDAAWNAREESVVEVQDFVGVEPLATTSNISYQKDNAINYALTFSSSYDDGTYTKPDASNPNFSWISGGNCMNFVSQCIWAGFGGSNSKTDIQNFYGMDREGTATNQWYSNGSGTRSASWVGTLSWKKYIDNQVNGAVGINAGKAVIAYNENTFPYSAETLKGAMLLMKGSTEEYGHAVFINGATGKTRDQVYITANNQNWKNKKLSEVAPVASTHNKNNLYLVIPTTFTTNASSSELRLWADLHNALPSGTTATLKGYANQKAYSWSMEITKPSGLKLYKSQLGDGSTVSTTHIFNEVGLWTVVLKANNASGTQKTFTYMVRIY